MKPKPEHAGILLGQLLVAPLMIITFGWELGALTSLGVFIVSWLIFKVIRLLVESGWVG